MQELNGEKNRKSKERKDPYARTACGRAQEEL